MRWKCVLWMLCGIFAAATTLWSQDQVVAVRAGRLFDAKSGQMLTDQVVLIKGDRVTDVGPAARVTIPAGARVIDLSKATVLPGMIDAHVHLTRPSELSLPYQTLEGLQSAQTAMNAGFTTLVDFGGARKLRHDRHPRRN